MKNKFEHISKSVICVLLLSLFFCNDVFARKFNARIDNDTNETLIISDVIKKYSNFDEDFQIEKSIQELKPKQGTVIFSVTICGDLCLKKSREGDKVLDGIYFTTKEGNGEIGAVWGEIINTGLTPGFGPLSKESTDKLFKTEISADGPSQNPVYVFTIKNVTK